MRVTSAVTALAMTVGLASAASAATVANGSFESNGGVPDGQSTTLTNGDTSILGWTVIAGSVDLVEDLWEPAEGDYSLELNGIGRGAVSTTMTDLVVGQTYEVSFAMSGNPFGQPAEKTMLVIAGEASDIFEYNVDDNGTTPEDMAWVTYSITFVADDTSETLLFASTTRGFFGPALDDVTIAAIPVPAAAGLLLSALGALAFARRRRSA